MPHRVAAVLTVLLLRLRPAVARLACSRGQGTVEYVGLILLIAGVLAAVVAWGNGFKGEEIGKVIVAKLKSAIDAAGGAG